MESYAFLLALSFILISTKLLGLFSRKIKLPAVVGALFAGILIGPCGLNLVTLTGQTGNYIKTSAEIGVIFLMFSAGLDTDMTELNKNLKASLLTAIIGVIIPLIGGALSYILFFKTNVHNYHEMLKAIFVGVVLTATSVSITVETLRELGKLKGTVGTTILGAAIIDDILGIIILSIVSSMSDPSIDVKIILAKILFYFIALIIISIIVKKLKGSIERRGEKQRISIYAISFCFLLSFISEHYFGVADITGAFFAGLMLSYMKVNEYIKRRIGYLSYLFFSPVFFASVGLETQVSNINSSLLLFTLMLTVIAILTKVVGCSLGSKVCGLNGKDSLRVGIGMISRGEVALIVAQKGNQIGLIDGKLFCPIIIVVIITTLITPILLKFAFVEREND